MKVLAVVFALVALTIGFKIETKMAKLIRVAKSNQCGPDETDCPNGCCPEANWYCCPDDFWPGCAPTAAECPFADKRVSLVKLAKTKTDQCGPDETECPVNCCPEVNWYCCPDGWCAATAADCP